MLDIANKKMYNINRVGENVTSIEEYDVTNINATTYTVSIPTLVGTMYYSFDSDGKQFRKKYVAADGTEQKYVYEYRDEQNVAVQLPTGVVSHAKSDHLGRKVFDELQLGNGLMNRRFTYHSGEITDAHKVKDENGKSKIVSTPETTLVKKIEFADGRTIEYEYDDEERITKVTDSIDGVYEYIYDALGQLLSETVNDVLVNTMTYDKYGNIRSKNGISYGYDTVWKDRLVSYNGYDISYKVDEIVDELVEKKLNGNPTSYLGTSATWEKGRQLKTFGTNSYKYNNDGIRIKKTTKSEIHDYILDGTNIVKEIVTDTCNCPKYTNEYLYDLDGTVCGLKHDGVAYYFYKNLQGDVIAITDDTGETVARYTYDAWGKVLTVKDANGTAITDINHIANINPFRYRSYYYDTETELYYLQSRYYDPEVGRFINADKIIDLRNNAFCNQYAYCQNNPISKIEVEGAFAITILGVTIGGTLLAKLVAVTVIAVAAIMIISTPEFQRAWNDLCIDFVNGIEKIGRGLTRYAENIVTAIEDALEEAKIRERTSKTERHHIVPKGSGKTAYAIYLMENVGISRNCKENLVDINLYLHKYLHTSYYLYSVNAAVVQAYWRGKTRNEKRRNIFAFLLTMKMLLKGTNELLK